MTPPEPTPRSRRSEPEEDPCLIPGCTGIAARHLALAEARRAFASLPERGRSAALCRDHYKEWKKATRESRRLDRMGW